MTNDGSLVMHKIDSEYYCQCPETLLIKVRGETTIKGEGKNMNKSIVALYDKTADAVLVDKHFGKEIAETFTGQIILSANKEAYLTEAKRREDELKPKA